MYAFGFRMTILNLLNVLESSMDIDQTALLILLLKNQAMLETIYETQSQIIARLDDRDPEDVYSEMIEKHEHIEKELLKLYREVLSVDFSPSVIKGEA